MRLAILIYNYIIFLPHCIATSNPAINITLFAIPQYDNPPPRIKESAYKLIAHLVDKEGPVAFGRMVNFTAPTLHAFFTYY